MSRFLPGLLLAVVPATASAQVADGLTLFQPLNSTTTYLIDESGGVVKTWPGTTSPGNSVYLLDNGNLLRTGSIAAGPGGGAAGRVEEVTWNGAVVWSFDYADANGLSHHDVEPMPNGNVLVVAWDLLTMADAVAAGRNPALVTPAGFAPDSVLEIQPDGQGGASIVWEWHVWDHLIQDFDPTKANFGVVADNPQLVDVNYPPVPTNDWNHVNSVDYDPALDQILISANFQNEVWVIDHSTTTQEAAGSTGGNSGMGGDLLYRWGNPAAYRAGTPADQVLFGQHDAQWIDPGRPGAGNFIVFNNGKNRPAGPFSSVDEWVSPVDANGAYPLAPGAAWGPTALAWSYTAPVPTDFYSQILSGAERLANGNTLICDGVGGLLFEVDAALQTVWQYQNPFPQLGTKWVFRARRYDVCGAAVYCTAKPNSLGCVPQIAASGAASTVDPTPFDVTASGVLNGRNGLFFYGLNGTAALPFFGGTLCLAPPLRRTAIQNAGGSPPPATDCSGTYTFDVNALIQGGTDPALTLGARVQAQFWSRDAQHPDGTGVGLTDAVEFVICE